MYVLDTLEYSRYDAGMHKYKVTIHVDTIADLPEAKAWWDQGSMAIIDGSHEIRWLDSDGEWR